MKETEADLKISFLSTFSPFLRINGNKKQASEQLQFANGHHTNAKNRLLCITACSTALQESVGTSVQTSLVLGK